MPELKFPRTFFDPPKPYHSEIFNTYIPDSTNISTITLAKYHGLKCWRMLRGQETIDIPGLVAAEQVLIKLTGSYYDKLGDISTHGWQLNSSLSKDGLAAKSAVAIWKMCGRKKTDKFDLLIEICYKHASLQSSILDRIKKYHSIEDIKNFMVGFIWVREKYEQNRAGISSLFFYPLSADSYIKLGTLSEKNRWALLHNSKKLKLFSDEGGDKTSPFITSRRLNWEMVKKVRNLHFSQCECIPKKVRYKEEWLKFIPELTSYQLGIHMTLTTINPREVKIKTLRKILSETLNIFTTTTPFYIRGEMGLFNRSFFSFGDNLLLPIINLVKVFKNDYDSLIKYLGHGSNEAMPTREDLALRFHNAGQFVLPDDTTISKGWDRLLLLTPSAADYLCISKEIEAIHGGVPKNITEIKAAVNKLPKENIKQQLMIQYKLSSSYLNDYMELVEGGTNKDWIGIPAPIDISEDEYTLVQLASDDIRQPLAGKLVNCCQHLHGAASSCAISSWEEPNAAIWAIFKKEVLIVQSFVWRSKKNDSIVLDSIEGPYVYSEIANRLYKRAAESVLGKLSVKRVLRGISSYGVTDEIECISDKVIKKPKAAFKLEYTDADHGCKIIAQL